MKTPPIRFGITIILICAALCCQCQKLLNENLILRSKEYKTAGLFLLGVGAAMTTGGIIGIQQQPTLDSNNAPYIITSTGLLSMLISIPLFITSSHQAQQASKSQTNFLMGISLAGNPKIRLTIRL